MKFIPILFSTEMVKAILEGRKTMTRRVVKPQPTKFIDDPLYWINPVPCVTANNGLFESIKSKYGQPGDVLWVRETIVKDYEHAAVYKADKEYVYLNNEPRIYDNIDISYFTEKRNYVPSIHMPKTACRIFLKIKSLRVERLQEISEADALAEGIHYYADGTFKNYFTKKGLREQDGVECLLAKGSFQTLWSEINGSESWNANTWVWVIEFERIEKPANF